MSIFGGRGHIEINGQRLDAFIERAEMAMESGVGWPPAYSARDLLGHAWHLLQDWRRRNRHQRPIERPAFLVSRDTWTRLMVDSIDDTVARDALAGPTPGTQLFGIELVRTDAMPDGMFLLTDRAATAICSVCGGVHPRAPSQAPIEVHWRQDDPDAVTAEIEVADRYARTGTAAPDGSIQWPQLGPEVLAEFAERLLWALNGAEVEPHPQTAAINTEFGWLPARVNTTWHEDGTQRPDSEGWEASAQVVEFGDDDA